MVWRDPKLFDAEFWGGVMRIFSVTGFTVLTTYIMVQLVPLIATDRGFIKLSVKLIAVVIPTFIVHIGLSSLFGLEEAGPVTGKLRQILFRPIRIQ